MGSLIVELTAWLTSETVNCAETGSSGSVVTASFAPFGPASMAFV